jgi:uncharacterized damage-inducible protein DinB
VNTDEIRTLYDYNTWANLRVVAMERRLTREGLTKDLATSPRSVQGTLEATDFLVFLDGTS